MGSIETLERSPRTRMGAYFYVVFMFAAAVFKTTAGLGELAGQDYLWRLFWIVAATGWALRMLYLADREPENSRSMWLARRGGVLIATLTFVGVAVI